MCVVNRLKQPLAYHNAYSIVFGLESTNTGYSLLSPNLEIVHKLQDPRFVISASHTHNVIVYWKHPAFFDKYFGCGYCGLRSALHTRLVWRSRMH